MPWRRLFVDFPVSTRSSAKDVQQPCETRQEHQPRPYFRHWPPLRLFCADLEEIGAHGELFVALAAAQVLNYFQPEQQGGGLDSMAAEVRGKQHTVVVAERRNSMEQDSVAEDMDTEQELLVAVDASGTEGEERLVVADATGMEAGGGTLVVDMVAFAVVEGAVVKAVVGIVVDWGEEVAGNHSIHQEGTSGPRDVLLEGSI